MTMRDRFPLGSIAASLCLAASPAQASTLLTATAADFRNDIPFGSIVDRRDVDGLPGTEFIRYGVGAGGGGFQVNRLHFQTSRNLSLTNGEAIDLGRLNLLNFPAFSIMTSVDLALSPILSIDGVNVTLDPLIASFAIIDTPNAGPVGACQFPSATPCADAVRFLGPLPMRSQAIASGTINYRLLGFSDGAGGFTDTLYADEFSAGERFLVGRFDFVPAAGGVPEPSAWALLILGFGITGGALRRARQPRVHHAYA